VVLFPTLIEIRSGKVSLRMLDKATKNNDLNIEVPGQNQTILERNTIRPDIIEKVMKLIIDTKWKNINSTSLMGPGKISFLLRSQNLRKEIGNTILE
jgi:hypothetical protein